MCGITGYSGRGDERILEKMNETLRHRGPDDAGLKVFADHRFDALEGNRQIDKKNDGQTDEINIAPISVGLAQRRLSIIDLSPAGHQPMSNEDGTIWIVFNGEIYNFNEARSLLKKKHIFKGKSDTEVIIHLYEEIGPEVFSKIQGMFAIALFDSKKNILILARDRMGKKPLYWSLRAGTLLFGSELKALMAHPLFKKEINLQSVNKYFLYEYVPTPHTIFKNTWKLEPGTFLEWDGKLAKKTQFWKPTFLPKENSFTDSLQALDATLQSAVKDRLISDVPLGIFLSGGLDSSAVAYYASKANQGKIKTFSIGFKEPSFDESAYARQVAKFLGTDHYEKILSVNECIDIIPKIGDLLDEPMADASIVPTYLLSQFTREHVTVALGGDGGDELFCGYDTFLAHRLARIYEKLPAIVHNQIFERLVGLLPTSSSNMSLDFKVKKFISGFERNAAYRNQRWLGAFDQKERQSLFVGQVQDQLTSTNVFEDIDHYKTEMDSRNIYDELGYLYERTYMMDQVLVKVDRASMMNSLEVRAPFLDTRVVDLANHLPASFKFKGLERKYILKKLMEGKLPDNIIYRKKKGFGMPIAEWLKGYLKPLVNDFLGPASIKKIGLFNANYVQGILAEHFTGKKDNRKQIWSLLVFAMWWRRWVC